jgi:hypothetical protein
VAIFTSFAKFPKIFLGIQLELVPKFKAAHLTSRYPNSSKSLPNGIEFLGSPWPSKIDTKYN